MKFKNFGLVSADEAGAMGEGFKDFLIKKGLIQNTMLIEKVTQDWAIDGSMSIKGSTSYLIRTPYIRQLGLEIQEFLLNAFKGYIGGDLELFKVKFNRECFGLELSDMKRIGLDYFNKYYDNWIDISKEYNYKGLPGTNPSTPRMSNLYIERKYLGEELRYEYDIIYKYIIGENDFFNENLLNSSKSLKEIMKFENEYLILQYLNDLFGFENEKSIDRNLILHEIFKENRTKIYSFGTILFIDYILSIEEYTTYAYGVALYDFLKSNKKINMPATHFSTLLLTYFPCNFKNLKYGYKGNAHRNKVNFFRNEWDNFSV